MLLYFIADAALLPEDHLTALRAALFIQSSLG
jgi:hypothetical protein